MTNIARTMAAFILFGLIGCKPMGMPPPPACDGELVTHYELSGRTTGYTCLPRGVNYSEPLAREGEK